MLYKKICIFSNKNLTPSEVGVNLKDGYNGDISAKDAGKIGGQLQYIKGRI
ncbi:MAG: small, acid-soluble spore protein, alpha/beta type [Clostridia bacterium]|nr:small, acid-soluble spore protein, alpha/beta type [Clostridia bacterium]